MGSTGHFVSAPPLENDGNLILRQRLCFASENSLRELGGKLLSMVDVTDIPFSIICLHSKY